MISTSTLKVDKPNLIGSASNVYQLRSGLLSAAEQDWKDDVEAKLEALIRLPDGWDGYQGVPVSFANAVFSLRMLESVCDTDSPSPQIVPGTNGDLQLEWHLPGGDVELHVRAPNDVLAWRAIERGTGVLEEELPLRTDFTSVAGWIRELAEDSIAPAAAAA
jgi:hypothetical protein